jgi:hypothetical protein
MCANICSRQLRPKLQTIVPLGPIWQGACTFPGGRAESSLEAMIPPDLEINSMKKTLLILCLLCTANAFGQIGASVISSEAQRFEVPSHEQHAFQQSIGEGKSLLITSSNVSGRGMRPLWELAPVKHEVPLGDTARMLKKQHDAAKKADIVWEN